VDKPLRTATEIGMQMIHGMIAAGRYPPFPLDPRGAYYNENTMCISLAESRSQRYSTSTRAR
jgi:hypothetical protein